MLQSGAEMKSVADVPGNSELILMRVYNHSSAASRRGAVDKLGSFHARDDKKSSASSGDLA